jgi:hypothetical protein
VNEPLKVNPSGERRCRCVRDHRPIPQELHRHHVWPLGEGGPNIATNLRWLCPSTHSNVHRLWREYHAAGGEPPWEVRRIYGGYVRQLVSEGWAQAHPSVTEKESP